MRRATKVSFIGTGSMGRPLIIKLLDKGYQVQVYDKYKEMSDKVVAAGAVWRDSPREAAQGSDVVVTCLPLPHHVLENMVGDAGALSGMNPGATWIDSSTTDYHNTLHIAGVAAQQGVFSLEAPVSNLSHMGVDFANVSFYVGGDRVGFDSCEDVLNTMGRVSFHVGKIGEGQTVKLFTNLLFYTAMLVWGEVLMIAKHLGIPLHWMWGYAKASRGDCFVTDQCTPFIFDGSYDRSCTLEITVKDTSLTVDLADELHVPLPIGRIMERRYRQAGKTYDAHDNHIIVTKLIEEDNNTDLRVPGFTAPSPYGADPDYRHPEGIVEDQYGRIKPLVPDRYQSPSYELDPKLVDAAHSLMEFMAYLNYCILHESRMLGRKMGLGEDLSRDVVRWSCGPSWVADHEDTFQPEPRILTRVVELGKGVKKLPVIHELLDVLPPVAG
jgi:3-hydroxyisobutyrate dehydrogenase-like beta-hydroxyacid dehydrogenase